MKYVVPESRIKGLVVKYLDGIDWQPWETEFSDHPLEVFGLKGENGATFIVKCMTHKYGESCNLLIRSSFARDLIKLFGKDVIGEGPDGEPNTLIMDWFNSRFKEYPVEDYLYMDSDYMANNDDDYEVYN
jgi:hypothetical protein